MKVVKSICIHKTSLTGVDLMFLILSLFTETFKYGNGMKEEEKRYNNSLSKLKFRPLVKIPQLWLYQNNKIVHTI